jgi:choline dehydrogenase-like flavoprotein
LIPSSTKTLVDSPEEFASQSCDYIIVGGGTGGLTLGVRLTEGLDVSAGIVEAGLNRLADPSVLVPGLTFSSISNPGYDRVFRAAPLV